MIREKPFLRDCAGTAFFRGGKTVKRIAILRLFEYIVDRFSKNKNPGG
jgi:hypothetical protein